LATHGKNNTEKGDCGWAFRAQHAVPLQHHAVDKSNRQNGVATGLLTWPSSA